jgi:AraC family transcriptional regulator
MNAALVLFEGRVADHTVAVVRYAHYQHICAHVHEEDGISIVLQGEVVEEAEHRTTVAGAGWARARPRGVRHTNRFGPHGAVVLTIIPDQPAFERFPRRWRWLESAVAYRAGLRVLASGEDALIHLLATLSEHRVNGAALRGAMMARQMLEHSAARLSITSLARQLGLHPVYLARQFRRAFGVSMREYQTILMVRRAIQAVLSDGASLTRIAFDCGFADQSHMCRAFRSVAGWRPSSLQRLRDVCSE